MFVLLTYLLAVISIPIHTNPNTQKNKQIYACLIMLCSHTMQHHPPTAICNALQQNREQERDRESRENQVESGCNTFKCSSKLKTQPIQFKALHRTSYTQHRSFLTGLTDTESCLNCTVQVPDNYTYALWSSPLYQYLGTQITSKLKSLTSLWS